jgi:hypothetical protein
VTFERGVLTPIHKEEEHSSVLVIGLIFMVGLTETYLSIDKEEEHSSVLVTVRERERVERYPSFVNSSTGT